MRDHWVSERSSRSSYFFFLQFKFGQVVDKQYVCLLKMLMVVNSGVPEFVQMIAPHEEWSYLDVGSGQVCHFCFSGMLNSC